MPRLDIETIPVYDTLKELGADPDGLIMDDVDADVCANCYEQHSFNSRLRHPAYRGDEKCVICGKVLNGKDN